MDHCQHKNGKRHALISEDLLHKRLWQLIELQETTPTNITQRVCVSRAEKGSNPRATQICFIIMKTNFSTHAVKTLEDSFFFYLPEEKYLYWLFPYFSGFAYQNLHLEKYEIPLLTLVYRMLWPKEGLVAIEFWKSILF